MSRKGKNFNKKVLGYDLVSSLKKDHSELSSLIGTFTNTLTGSELEQARKLLCQIEDLAKSHFKFENDYLYPRMHRLLHVLLEKLSVEQQTLQESIGRSQSIFKKRNRLTKNGSSVVSEMAFAISRHLKDCDDVILLAEKFSSDEKNELDKKLKEYQRRG